MNRLITLTGLDRVGKQTQTLLLKHAIAGAGAMTAPDYTHWSGQLIRAILEEQAFTLGRGETILDNEADPIEFYGPWRQSKEPYTFQALQFCNLLSQQERLTSQLREGHVVADRYDVDALAFGLIDGCDIPYLLTLWQRIRNSDLAVIMLGSPYPRPGERPDMNERDGGFQQRCWGAYEGWTKLYPHLFVPIYVDQYRERDPAVSMTRVHRAICDTVSRILPDVACDALTEEGVRAVMGLPFPKAPRQLTLV